MGPDGHEKDTAVGQKQPAPIPSLGQSIRGIKTHKHNTKPLQNMA